MPLLTRWFLRAGLFYLVLALVMGVALAARPAGVSPGLRPLYLHLLLVGWITQLIFGVAHWMFPRGPDRDRPRGREELGWAAFVLLNTGLVFRAIAEPLGIAGLPLVVSGSCQLAAGAFYAVHIWPRIRRG